MGRSGTPSGRFVFELEAVLEQRQRLEDEHQRRVATVERERVAVEDRLRDLQQGIGAAKDELRAQLAPASPPGAAGATIVPVHIIRLRAGASVHLAGRAQQVALELAGVHRRLEAARRELIRATTARKAVELLRTRRHDEWRRARAKRELAEIDELSVMRAARTDGIT